MNITFTDDEMAMLRATAAKYEVSLKAFAHRAITDAASDYRSRVQEAGEFVAQRSGELNRRLA